MHRDSVAPVVPYRVRQVRERERDILRVAAELITQHGYHATSMDDIAGALGIAKGTLYQHFASKEALVVALVQERFSSLLDSLRAARVRACSPAGALLEALRLLFEGQSQGLRIFDVTAGAMLALADCEPLHGLRLELNELLVEIVRDGQASGEVDPSIDPRIAASALYALSTPRPYRTLLATGHADEASLVEELGRLYLGGIASPARAGRK